MDKSLLKFLHFNLQIVSKSLSEPIRSHKDLDKDSAPHYHKAVKFYEALSKQLVHQGHVLDVFACALDQVLINVDCMLEKIKIWSLCSSNV